MIKQCVVCGGEFDARGAAKCCSMKCSVDRSREQNRMRQRKYIADPAKREHERKRLREYWADPLNRERKIKRQRHYRADPANRKRVNEQQRRRYWMNAKDRAKDREQRIEYARRYRLEMKAALAFVREIETKGTIGALFND